MTVKRALALVRPAAEAVTVALPAVVGVKLVVATPSVGVTGEAGSKVPETPVKEKVTGLVALVTVFQLES